MSCFDSPHMLSKLLNLYTGSLLCNQTVSVCAHFRARTCAGAEIHVRMGAKKISEITFKVNLPLICWHQKVKRCLVLIHRTCWVNYGPFLWRVLNPHTVGGYSVTPLLSDLCLEILTECVDQDLIGGSICTGDRPHNTWGRILCFKFSLNSLRFSLTRETNT